MVGLALKCGSLTVSDPNPGDGGGIVGTPRRGRHIDSACTVTSTDIYNSRTFHTICNSIQFTSRIQPLAGDGHTASLGSTSAVLLSDKTEKFPVLGDRSS